MSKIHKKHPPLIRPISGVYHNCEWAIYGTSCDEIDRFYNIIKREIGNSIRLSYVDMDKNAASSGKYTHQRNEKRILASDLHIWNEADNKLLVRESDVVIVNGNHYQASRQNCTSR